MPQRFKLSLGAQAITTLIPTLAGLAWLTAESVSSARDVVSSSERQILFGDIAASAGAVVHETQKERGLTSGALGSNSAALLEKLPGQRALRDEKIVALKTLVQDLDTSIPRSWAMRSAVSWLKRSAIPATLMRCAPASIAAA